MTQAPQTPLTQIRRSPHKGRAERAALEAILDEGRVAHVAFIHDGQPVCIPVASARDGDRLLLHGSTGSRLFRTLAEGAACSVAVTLLDGLVFARSAYESSMHYRSAVVFGTARALTEGAEHLAGLKALTEALYPGRWSTLRPPTRRELAATLVLELPLEQWSVKVSDGEPGDPEEDLDAPVWAGVLPLVTSFGTPVPAANLRVDAAPPAFDGDRLLG